MALVREYTGYDFCQIGEMDIIDYMAARRDAFIHGMEQTPEGREYLRKAWLLTQTEPDIGALRQVAGGR